MNRVLWLFALCTLHFALQTPQVFAAFEDTGTGARPTVMGGTFVAAGEDVQSLMYNPAGLAGLRQHELSSEYSKLYTGLSDGSDLGQYYFGYGQPIKYGGTMAFGWKQLKLDDLYTERTLSLGYGEWITPRIALGLAGKQLHHSFGVPNMSVDDNGNITNQSPSFFRQYGNSSTAYSMDLGMLFRYTDRKIFGLSIQDINEPNIALNPNDHEIVSKTIRAAYAYKGRKGLTLAGSLTTKQSLANQRDTIYTGAAEKWWDLKDHGSVAARGSLATGSRSFQQMATGASYRFDSYQVDYAFVFNLTGMTLGNTAGTHRFSFGWRFGKDVPTPVRRPAKKPAIKKAKAAEPKEVVTITPSTHTVVVSSPVVSPADIAVLLRDVETQEPKRIDIRSREALLTRVGTMLDGASARGPEVTGLHRVVALEPVFDVFKGYIDSSNQDVLHWMDEAQTLEDAAVSYARLKFRGVTVDGRFDYLVGSVERYLDPALRKRPWNQSDRRDIRYSGWLNSAWKTSENMVRRGSEPMDRVQLLQRIVRKSLDYERMPPEPIIQPVLKPAPAMKKIPSRSLQRRNVAQERYLQAMHSYDKQVAAGATPGQRIDLLRGILKDCDAAQLDCVEAFEEFEALFNLGAKKQKRPEKSNVDDAGRRSGGASIETRDFLQDMIEEPQR